MRIASWVSSSLPSIILSSNSSIIFLYWFTSLYISSIEISPSLWNSKRTSTSLRFSSISFQSFISFSILDIFFSTTEAFLVSFQKMGSVDFSFRTFNFFFNKSISKIPPKHGILMTSLRKKFFYFRYFHLVI